MSDVRPSQEPDAQAQGTQIVGSAHAHVLDEEKSAVLTVFNLDSDPRTIGVAFDPADLGFPPGSKLKTPEAIGAKGAGAIRLEREPNSPRILHLSWR